MFGWNDREMKLRLENVPDAVRGHKELRGLEREFAKLVDELRKNISRLSDSVNALGSMASGSKYSDNVKNRFCMRANELLQISYPESILDAGKFHDDAKARLGELGSINIKEFRHLAAFKDDMKFVADGLKSAENAVSEIGKILDYPVSRNAMGTMSIIASIGGCEKSAAGMQEDRERILSRIGEAEGALKLKRKELQQALASGEYMRAEMMENEIERLNRNTKTIETKISEEFSHMDRVFRKFSHINSYESELVKKYIDDGFAAFLGDEDNKIKIILDKMRTEAGKLSIEGKKLQKLTDILRSMSLFSSLRNQYKELKNRVGEMSADMPPIKRDVERLQSEVSSIEGEIVKLKKDAESKNKNIAALNEKIVSLKAELADSAEKVLGKKVILVE